MNARPLDVAIVGAGHNGLVAAAYLARAGLSVTAFERRELVGGACVTEELWPGVRASPGAYTLSLLRAEIARDLDLHAHGLDVEVRAVPVRAPSRRSRGGHVVRPAAHPHPARARLDSRGRRRLPRGTIDIGYDLGDLADAAADARAGRPAGRPWIESACQTSVDDSLAPPERHVVSLFCQCFPADSDAQAAADSAIARFAEVCPGLPDRIVDSLALGPRELEARFGITGGHIFHGEMLPGQLFEQRNSARRFGGIDGLYLGGSGAHPGGAVTGAPGYLAARAVLEDVGAG